MGWAFRTGDRLRSGPPRRGLGQLGLTPARSDRVRSLDRWRGATLSASSRVAEYRWAAASYRSGPAAEQGCLGDNRIGICLAILFGRTIEQRRQRLGREEANPRGIQEFQLVLAAELA